MRIVSSAVAWHLFGFHCTGCHSKATASAPFMLYCGFNLAKGKRHFQALDCWIRLRTEQGVWVHNQRGPRQRKCYNNLNPLRTHTDLITRMHVVKKKTSK